MGKKYGMIIVAKNIFDSVGNETYEGAICIQDNRIAKIVKGHPEEALLTQGEEVYQLDKELVMPGIVDTHTFFTGYAVYHLGADFSNVLDNENGRKILKNYDAMGKKVLFGHGWNPEQWSRENGEQLVEEQYPDKPVIIFSADRSNCIMNQKAKELYQFTGDSCYPESYYRIMREYLNDREFIEKEFADYMSMLNERGITTVKEMGFDDFYGFTEYLKEMEESENLKLRFFFMSQPVGERMNLPYARSMRKKFVGNKVRFSGFNRMTDGTIADMRGDLKQPYEGKIFNCSMEIPYDEIEADVLAADKEGFRWSLHAQGDGAVGKIAEIYNKCEKENGKLKNKQALTDLEFTDPEDLEKLGEMGATAEVYFQIMSLDSGDVLKESIQRTIGTERGKYYWNRRKMLDSGINVCGATDLPLMITNVPESIYYSSGGYLDGVNEPFQRGNTITPSEMLKAWTIAGQKNLEMDDVLGTLEEGKIADIAIFDRDLTKVDTKEVKNAKNIMTIMDGKIVYKRERG